MPGTQAASSPVPGTMSRPSSVKRAIVAAAGAGPCPQMTSGLPRFTSWRMTGTSPPGPLRCGSTTCRVNAVATAASKALPPFSSVAMPTAVAIQCVEVTTPKVPSISGRVVNGLLLMFGATIHLFAGSFYLVVLAGHSRPRHARDKRGHDENEPVLFRNNRGGLDL